MRTSGFLPPLRRATGIEKPHTRGKAQPPASCDLDKLFGPRQHAGSSCVCCTVSCPISGARAKAGAPHPAGNIPVDHFNDVTLNSLSKGMFQVLTERLSKVYCTITENVQAEILQYHVTTKLCSSSVFGARLTEFLKPLMKDSLWNLHLLCSARTSHENWSL